ncbi:properdin-like [Denticeps clupeoides]|uniref:properdin-like n=1 Tax=Denticeps clupeoides TaxID=299321 RepID=UPI0010A43E22|nr:properdin [Denticeps clupeoides]
MSLVLPLVLLMAFPLSASQDVECYSEFDEVTGNCVGVLGHVKMEHCCLNTNYAYKEKGECMSCRRASWSEWTPWSACTVSCKEGVKHRRRKCHGIGDCTDGKLRDLQTVPCNDQTCCPEKGGWAEWGRWEPCTVTCGIGETRRRRTCSSPLPACGGDCDGLDQEVKTCDTEIVCPTHGGWAHWGPWGTCSGHCKNEGMIPPSQSRTRTCTNPAPSSRPAGHPCQGPDAETQDCSWLHFCPVPGNWGPWSTFSDCHVTCGVGRQVRTRQCDSPAPKHGGQPCQGDGKSFQLCNTLIHCPVDGVWRDWSPWVDCKKGGSHNRPINCKKKEGSQRRERFCEGTAFEGKPCNGSIVDFRSCYNIDKCFLSANWSEWSEWSDCVPPCGDGSQRTRVRECKADLSGYKTERSSEIFFYGKPRIRCARLEETSQSIPCHNVPKCENID